MPDEQTSAAQVEYDEGYKAGCDDSGVDGCESVYWLHGYWDAVDDEVEHAGGIGSGARWGRP